MSDVHFRRAGLEDLPVLVRLLSDDRLGAGREAPAGELARSYIEAFHAVAADPNQYLAVMTDGPQIVGMLQLSFIPGLSRQGAWRGQIESVRVAAGRRGEGLGERMLTWAIDQCRARGCRLVQLTTDNSRTDAHRFYDRLGFVASHVGYKLEL
jgi:ribosomal protein S18 acetylase RimI-like enzyme